MHPALVFLDSVRRLYPTGIPKSLVLKRTAPTAGLPKLVAIFVRPSRWQLPEQELLQTAIAKGLKSRPDQTLVLTAGEYLAQATSFDATAPLVALGEAVLAELLPDQPLAAGDWGALASGTPVLASRSIAAVISDPAEKRAFWGDLKQILARG